MELLLSALGILLGTLMNIPGRTVAAKEKQKTQLAKTLYGLHVDIVKCVSSGKKIAAALDELLETQEDLNSRFEKREILLKMVREQTNQLSTIGNSATKGLIWSTILWNIPNPSGGKLLQEEDFFDAKIEKVLSVYHPGLSQHIRSVIEPKEDHLEMLAKLLETSLEQLDFPELKLKIVKRFTPPEDYFESKYSFPEYDEIDLSDRSQKNAYISSIYDRISELEAGAEKLRELIHKYYEPHHLI